MPKLPKHIVAIRLSAMGDVAMTVPVLRALTQQYPDVRVTIVSRTFFAPFFSDIPNVSFFEFDDKIRHEGNLGLWQLFLDIRALKPDAFLDLHSVIRTKLLRFMFRLVFIRVANIYKDRQSKKEITSITNKKFRQIENVFEKQQKALNSLGFEVDLSKIIYPKKTFLSEDILHKTQLNLSSQKIGIAPFAQYDSKIYPLDLMQIVIDHLASNLENQILLFGGGNPEIEKLNSLKNNHQNVIVIAGKATFKQEIDIISNLDVMLSMDSGNAHIAAMKNVQVVTLWGATHPYAGFNPFGQPLENAIVSDREKFPLLPTSVYGNKIVQGYQDVMRTILPQTVVARINKILNKSNQ